jgi:hypothetical protein
MAFNYFDGQFIFLLRHARLIFAAIICDIPSVDFAAPNHNGQMTKSTCILVIRLYSDLIGKSKRPHTPFACQVFPTPNLFHNIDR